LMEEHAFTWLAASGRWEAIAAATLIASLLLAFSVRVRARLVDTESALMPDESATVGSVAEAFVELMNGIATSVIGHGGERYVPLLGAFFAFILASNLLGLIPGFTPPTSSFDVTFGLGLVSFCAYNAYGVRAQGVGAYLKHFLGPVIFLAPLMLIIEIFSHGFRPLSLAIRLFANMFADHQVIERFIELTYAIIPVAFYVLGAFVCVVQAFVFTMLTAIYIAGAVSHDH